MNGLSTLFTLLERLRITVMAEIDSGHREKRTESKQRPELAIRDWSRTEKDRLPAALVNELLIEHPGGATTVSDDDRPIGFVGPICPGVPDFDAPWTDADVEIIKRQLATLDNAVPVSVM